MTGCIPTGFNRIEFLYGFIYGNEERNLQTQAMVRMFGLLAETDRELVSIHTREGLAAARDKGKKLGRPEGSLGRSMLDGRTEEIKRLLA